MEPDRREAEVKHPVADPRQREAWRRYFKQLRAKVEKKQEVGERGKPG